jgi:hypothetical protein
MGAVLALALIRNCQADQLQAGIDQIVRRVVGVLDTRQLKTVKVLEVANRSKLSPTGLAGIKQRLIDTLTKQRRYSSDSADLGLKVEVSDVTQYQVSGLSLAIEMDDAFGNALPAYNRTYYMTQEGQEWYDVIPGRTVWGRNNRFKEPVDLNDGKIVYDQFDSEDFLSVYGGNGVHLVRFNDNQAPNGISAGFGDRQREDPAEILRTPSFHFSENAGLGSSPNSPYRLQVVVNGVPRSIRELDEAPFIDLAMDEKYQLWFTNASSETVAIRFTIDGLNSFYFSEVPGKHPSNAWIVPAGMTLKLTGWFKKLTGQGLAEAEEFVTSSFAKSARREAGLTEEPIGGITVAVLEAVPKGLNFGGRPQFDASVPQIVENTRMKNEDGNTVVVPIRKPYIPYGVAPAASRPVRAGTDIYTGRGLKTQQVAGANQALTPGTLLEVLTVRYRHPAR